jgi:hypothetical protein
MSSKVSSLMKAIVLSLVCAVALSIPAYGGQGNGKGQGKGRNRISIERDSTPGIPTSSRGRGRNYNPGIRRGRYIRTTSIVSTRNRTFVTPRRVRRGRNITPGTARRSIN